MYPTIYVEQVFTVTGWRLSTTLHALQITVTSAHIREFASSVHEYNLHISINIMYNNIIHVHVYGIQVLNTFYICWTCTIIILYLHIHTCTPYAQTDKTQKLCRENFSILKLSVSHLFVETRIHETYYINIRNSQLSTCTCTCVRIRTIRHHMIQCSSN